MFDAIFFDLDGTLIDTESLAMACNVEAFAALGQPVSEDILHAMVGKDFAAVTEMLQQHMPDLDLPRLVAEVEDRFNRGMDAGLALKSGAHELLAHLPAPAALVTSSGRDGAHRKLQIAGIAAAFVTVVTATDVTRRKPYPDPYLLAAERLGVDPRRCLVFEDSEIGAEAAYRAGCVVVQVPDFLPPTGRWAHHVAPDLLRGAAMAGLTLTFPLAG